MALTKESNLPLEGLNMHHRKFSPTFTERAAASSNSRHVRVVSYVRMRTENKPVFKSGFNLTSVQLNEVAARCEESLLNTPVDEGKVFIQW